MVDFIKRAREKRNEESRALVRSIREKHDQINKSMDRLIDSRTPFFGFEVPVDKLQRSGVPQPIIDHLQHESLARLREEAERRRQITAEVERSLSLLEEDPEQHRQEVVNILKLFKEAEESIIRSHNPPKGEMVYQTAFDVTDTALRAIGMLKDQKKLRETPELEEARSRINGIREYCRMASERHALWADHRNEIKRMLAELGGKLGVEVDKSLLSTPTVYDVYVGIDAHPEKIKSMARKLLGGS